MTKPYLNFESVVSNLAWLAGSGAVRLWRDRLSMRMLWDFFMLYFLHSSPSFLPLCSWAGSQNCFNSERLCCFRRGYKLHLNAGLTSLHVIAPYLSYRSQTGYTVFCLETIWLSMGPSQSKGQERSHTPVQFKLNIMVLGLSILFKNGTGMPAWNYSFSLIVLEIKMSWFWSKGKTGNVSPD